MSDTLDTASILSFPPADHRRDARREALQLAVTCFNPATLEDAIRMAQALDAYVSGLLPASP